MWKRSIPGLHQPSPWMLPGGIMPRAGRQCQFPRPWHIRGRSQGAGAGPDALEGADPMCLNQGNPNPQKHKSGKPHTLRLRIGRTAVSSSTKTQNLGECQVLKVFQRIHGKENTQVVNLEGTSEHLPEMRSRIERFSHSLQWPGATWFGLIPNNTPSSFLCCFAFFPHVVGFVWYPPGIQQLFLSPAGKTEVEARWESRVE